MNIQALMKQAQSLQKDMLKSKEEIDKIEFTSTKDLVTVKVNGKKEVLAINIKEEVEEKIIGFHSNVMRYMQIKMNLQNVIIARIFFGSIMWAACDNVNFDDVWVELEKLI